ncbi:MAG: START domain-containing protein [Pseudomonadales bacterium]|nr:START domain-containing protein [Pseudomonadales bacterium]
MNPRLHQLFWLVATIVATVLSIDTVNADWTLKKDDEGIQVYTQPNPNSPLDEFKGTVELRARLSSLVKLIRDTDHSQDWMHSSGGTEVIIKINPQEQVIRNITLSPWPVSDRDVILKASSHQDPETLIITIELHSLSNHTPEQAGFVRMPKLDGKWVFKPMAQGVVQVSYELKIDPGGSIPGWLARSSTTDIPFNTLKQMREIVKKPVYKTAVVEDVIEP